MIPKKIFFILSLLLSGALYAAETDMSEFVTYFTNAEKRHEMLLTATPDGKATFEKLFAFYESLQSDEKGKFEEYIRAMNSAFVESVAKVESINSQHGTVIEKCKAFCGFKNIKISVSLSGD